MPKAKRERSAAYAELMPEQVREALQRRADQAVEYGTYVATMDIPVPFGTVLAYTKGSPVPVSNVERWDYDMEENYVGEVCVAEVGTPEYDEHFNPNTTATIALSMDSLPGQVHPALAEKLNDVMQRDESQTPAQKRAATKAARAEAESQEGN